ncbi:MAG TPA: FAD-binding protein, partial [Acidimicrobiales bacterium]|nr:FAD-binding protein [Acidimicrobiales bacterium]
MKWQNWSGRVTAHPEAIRRPRGEEELAEFVSRGERTNGEIRVVGSAHSHSPVAATDGLLLDLSDLSGLIDLDRGHMEVTLAAGTAIHQIGPLLRPHGLALLNQGDIDRQAIAGAVATGTHGTGRTLGNFPSAVRAMTMITADGSTVRCSPRENPDLFEASRLSLGAFGVVTRLTLAVRDSYRLHERIWLEDLDSVMARIDELFAATRHFEFFWYPGRTRAVCKSLEETEAGPDPMEDNRWERIGWSDEIISSERNDLHTEIEYSLPAESGPACLNELRALISAEFPDLEWPLEYRAVAADDVWLSPAHGRDTVTISVHQGVGHDDEALFRACEGIFTRYEGRPHWGKVHFLDGGDLAKLHPHWRSWWRQRDL